MSESDLYPAIKRFLEARGFEVKGEVGGCDVVGVRAGTPALVVITELKLAFSLELVLQGVDRLAIGDEVWLAFQAGRRTRSRRGQERDRRVRTLCRMLGLGLLVVHPARGEVQVVVEPGPYRPRPNKPRRASLLKEHAGRRGDPSPGGTRGVPVVTAYRQEALACAARLQAGPLSTRALAVETPRATAILYRNVYGWFSRVSRGVYALTDAGAEAVRRWG